MASPVGRDGGRVAHHRRPREPAEKADRGPEAPAGLHRVERTHVERPRFARRPGQQPLVRAMRQRGRERLPPARCAQCRRHLVLRRRGINEFSRPWRVSLADRRPSRCAEFERGRRPRHPQRHDAGAGYRIHRRLRGRSDESLLHGAAVLRRGSPLHGRPFFHRHAHHPRISMGAPAGALPELVRSLGGTARDKRRARGMDL
ncbi:MAG: hypothetical protein BWY59_01926 [Verrucomicrobia bacterium ADurb.Bin345]|nr:MAG: hypothetical protein BWY59_01926 [Verrucomicrobia bacterium ADurb.Bin345]